MRKGTEVTAVIWIMGSLGGEELAFFFFLKILFKREREKERESETQAEGKASSMQGAGRGTRSQVSRIMPWAAGGAKPLSHPGCPDEHKIFANISALRHHSHPSENRVTNKCVIVMCMSINLY